MSNVEWLISRDPDKTLHLLISTTAELNNDHILSLLGERPLHIIAFLEELVVRRLELMSRYFNPAYLMGKCCIVYYPSSRNLTPFLPQIEGLL